MKKPFEKNLPRIPAGKKPAKIAKQVIRAWDLAARLDRRNVKGKQRRKG